MELGNRLKLLVALNLLYFVLHCLEITFISLLSYFVFLSLVGLTAMSAIRPSKIAPTAMEFVDREWVECAFRQTYMFVN